VAKVTLIILTIGMGKEDTIDLLNFEAHNLSNYENPTCRQWFNVGSVCYLLKISKN
jgi:hypothetical protein